MQETLNESLFNHIEPTQSNASERRLLELCRSLSPAPLIVQHPRFKAGNVEHELCDVLIVDNATIIMFSDKAGMYHSDKQTDIAWGRWYKKRIASSIQQLRGAEKTLQRGTTVFTRFGVKRTLLNISLPAYEKADILLIAVARGASRAIQQFKAQDSTSIFLSSRLQDEKAHGDTPFTYHRLDDGGRYVHLLDEAVLEHLFHEMKQLPKLISYLQQKERFLCANAGKLFPGEDSLLGHYLLTQESLRARGCEESPFSHFPAELNPSALLDWQQRCFQTVKDTNERGRV